MADVQARLKIVTPVIVAAALAATVLIVARRPPAGAIALKGGAVVITKAGATLAEVARAINDASVFSYNDAERRAQTSAHIVVDGEGSLTIGGEEHELLEFNTTSCGNASLRIGPKARVDVVNAEIATTHRTVSAGVCTRGYIVICDGTLAARHAKFLYVSGNRSEFLRGEARGTLEDVEISLSDGASLRMVDVDGKRLDIRNCSFKTAGKYGVYLFGKTASPVRIENSVMLGPAADVFLSMGKADLTLVDCTFRKEHVMFANATGEVSVKWRVRVLVQKNGRPAAGVAVAAVGNGETVQGTTGGDGAAVLEVTESVISSGGTRAVTPHRFRALDGGKILAEGAPTPVTGTGAQALLAIGSVD